MDTNKFILITGATSGIGEAAAIELSNTYNIVISGRNSEKLQQTLESCSKINRVLIWVCDLEIERKEIQDSLNSFLTINNIAISAFIHCAGTTEILPFRHFPIEKIDSIFNVNLFSALEILKVLLRKCNKGELTQIIFISSLSSIRGNKGNSIYSAAKGAINSLVYTLAKELAPKIRVNALLLGAINTPMLNERMQETSYKIKMQEEYPLGIGSVEDVITYIEFLLNPKTKWITGQNIVLDGGRTTL